MAETATGTYDRAAETVYAALLEGLPETRLKITRADSEQGIVWAKTRATWVSWIERVTMLAWGEAVTIFVEPRAPEQTDVTVESRYRLYRYPAGSVHRRNFAAVFDMLDRRLATVHQVPPGYWARD
jgi:hypothetical protein